MLFHLLSIFLLDEHLGPQLEERLAPHDARDGEGRAVARRRVEDDERLLQVDELALEAVDADGQEGLGRDDLERAELLAVEGHAVALQRALELEHAVLAGHAAVAHDGHDGARAPPLRRRGVVAVCSGLLVLRPVHALRETKKLLDVADGAAEADALALESFLERPSATTRVSREAMRFVWRDPDAVEEPPPP